MSDTPIETIDTLLESVEADVDDEALGFKLRTARQLLLVLRERETVGQEALEHADIDPETREQLRELGYLE
ncbi:hypothetical protein [Halopenitus sp. POP-27]|uniref:hypothetical protein n=1 Tax=Halopenitus sp. POP-27 TaxID=2994425 RepID=UPI002469288E|nr:hypothetical protein [Halopenitus sp. POP-27]